MEKLRLSSIEYEDRDNAYFGEEGKNMFYQRCQWLQQQGEIASSQSRDSVSNAYFDKSKDTVVFSRRGWKGHKKNHKSDDDESSLSTTQSVASSRSNATSLSSLSPIRGPLGNSVSPNREKRSIGTPCGYRNKPNSLLSATRSIYTTDLKLLSPRTRFISSCMKEGKSFDFNDH